mmetsp:Transcript_7139/g.12619  ORF Transcript_7139/g.12619 Transcript_7139/m.12619 type:complete len:89 (+) Transcript_7139:31-297(+)
MMHGISMEYGYKQPPPPPEKYKEHLPDEDRRQVADATRKERQRKGNPMERRAVVPIGAGAKLFEIAIAPPFFMDFLSHSRSAAVPAQR